MSGPINIITEFINLDWSDIVLFDDVELAYDRFLISLMMLFNSNKCLKGNHKKKSSPRKSWITFSLLRCINKKNRLYKEYCKTRNDTSHNKFKRYRNILNRELKTAREKYYYDLLQVNKNNLSKVWQIINELIGKSKQDRVPTFL